MGVKKLENIHEAEEKDLFDDLVSYVRNSKGDSPWLSRLEKYVEGGDATREIAFYLLCQIYLRKSSNIRLGYIYLKNLIEFFGALMITIILSPLFFYIAYRIKKESPGPVFFKQIRSGYHGRPFSIWKFRTMFTDAEERRKEFRPLVKLFDKDPRLTKIGLWLRNYKLDELPQLFNVLRGEMNLIGPRPLPVEESAIIDLKNFYRFSVKPGMTGLWQVKHPGSNSVELKLELDRHYATYINPLLDLQIALRTIPVCLKGERAYK